MPEPVLEPVLELVLVLELVPELVLELELELGHGNQRERSPCRAEASTNKARRALAKGNAKDAGRQS